MKVLCHSFSHALSVCVGTHIRDSALSLLCRSSHGTPSSSDASGQCWLRQNHPHQWQTFRWNSTTRTRHLSNNIALLNTFCYCAVTVLQPCHEGIFGLYKWKFKGLNYAKMFSILFRRSMYAQMRYLVPFVNQNAKEAFWFSKEDFQFFMKLHCSACMYIYILDKVNTGFYKMCSGSMFHTAIFHMHSQNLLFSISLTYFLTL